MEKPLACFTESGSHCPDLELAQEPNVLLSQTPKCWQFRLTGVYPAGTHLTIEVYTERQLTLTCSPFLLNLLSVVFVLPGPHNC